MNEMASTFRIIAYRQVPLRPNGTETRNSFVADVEVDGTVHQIYIRQSGRAHIPQALIGHPRASEIREAVGKYVLEHLHARLAELRKTRRP